MKKYIYFLLALFIPISSCKDFLNEEMVSGISYDYYDTEKGLKDLLWSCYEPIRFLYSDETGLTLSQFGTDAHRYVGAGSNRIFHQYTSTLDANQTMFHSLWTSYYSGINRCNIAINRIPKFMDGKDFLRTEDDRNVRESEARFLRAYYYFTLVQTFGKVPLLLEENISVLTDLKRSTIADAYDAIIADLTIAEEYLPTTPSEYGRATKGAAMHLLAKVYLTRGSAVKDQRGQQSTDMGNAALYAQKVIDLGQYSLLDNFADVFDPDNQKNKEIIFAVQFTTNKLGNGTGNMTHLFFLCAYDQFAGMSRDLINGRSYTRLRPTDYLLDVYDRKYDSRFYKIFRTVHYCNNPGAAPKWTSANAPSPELVGQPKFALGDTALYFSMDQNVSDIEIAKKPYHWLPRNKFTELYYLAMQLYLDPFREDVQSTNGTRDWFLMRLGETYLIAAEAYGRKGDYTKALELLNTLRERASYKEGEKKPAQYYMVEGGSEADLYKSTKSEMTVTLEQINSPEKLRDFILDERARECHFEYQRWYDLVRTETFYERVKEYNTEAMANVKEYHKLRPIPQAHIDRLANPGSNEEEQNEGYY
jgi:hypothetical protein